MEVYKLTGETVDMLSDKIGEMYKAAGCTTKETYRAKLLLEEALLKYQGLFGEDVELTFRVYRVLGENRFSVRLRTASFDPFTLEQNPMAFMIKTIMSSFENGMPTWKYRNMENEIVFSIRKKATVGSLTKILIAVVSSVILGIAARLIFSADALTGFVGDYIDPLSDAYAGLFCVMAVLLTLFAIALSIVHIGDMAAVGALGGRIMRRFLIFTAIIVVVLTLPLLPFFEFGQSGSLNVAAKSIYDILVGFIPTNFVAPFLNFNSVHIMIVGAMFGFSLLSMGQKGSALVEIFDECNLVAVITNNFLNKFIHIYVGLKVFSIVSASQFSQLAQAGKMVGVILIGILLIFVFYTLYTHFKTKMPLPELIKTLTPATVICLSSANFGASFSSLFDSMLAAGVDGDTAGLTINLGSVFFRPCSTIMLVFSTIFMASYCGTEISVIWLIMAVFLSIVLAGSMPNIPGAAISVLPLLYAQLNILDGLPLMITISALLQFITVSLDTWCLQCEVLCVHHGRKKMEE